MTHKRRATEREGHGGAVDPERSPTKGGRRRDAIQYQLQNEGYRQMMLKKERNGMLKNKIDQIRSTRNVINQVMDRIVTKK